MTPPSPSDQPAAKDLNEVAALFRPWLPVEVRPSETHATEAVLIHGQRSLRCLVRRITSANISTYAIESALAHAALWPGLSGQRTVPLLIVARLDTRLVQVITRAVDTIQASGLPLTNLAVLSRNGGAVIRLPSWNLDAVEPDPEPTAPKSLHLTRGPGPDDLTFTAGTVRLLKSLLYTEVHVAGGPASSWWQGQLGPFPSVEAWARGTKVSRATAYRLHRILQDAGHLASGPRLTLVGAERLLERWANAASMEAAARFIPIKPLYAPPKSDDTPNAKRTWLRTVEQDLHTWGGLIAINGWHALAVLGGNIVIGDRPLTAVVPSRRILNKIITAGPVRNCTPQEAWAHLTVAKQRHAVFDGTVAHAGATPVVDLWQAALDVTQDRNRGFEQAQAIIRMLMAYLR